MKYLITNIDLKVFMEDVVDKVDEDDFALPSDYITACEEQMEILEESVPKWLVVELNETFDSETPLKDAIEDKIYEKLGFWTKGFDFQEFD